MTTRDELLETFYSINRALISNDTVKLKSLLDDDYWGIDIAGKLQNKELILKQNEKRRTKLEKFEYENLNVDVIDNIGIIFGKAEISGRKKKDHFEHRLRFLDFYVRKNNCWKYYLSKESKLK